MVGKTNSLNIVSGGEVMEASFTVTLEEMTAAVNNYQSKSFTNKEQRDFVVAQKGIFNLTITTPLGALGMTLYPSL